MAIKRQAGGTSPVKGKKVTRAGRERMQLLVDPALLAAASVVYRTTNKSDAVNAALRSAGENAAILRGLDEAMGSIPDFPYLDT